MNGNGNGDLARVWPLTVQRKAESGLRAAIKVMHEALGVGGRMPPKFVIDVFVEVGELG